MKRWILASFFFFSSFAFSKIIAESGPAQVALLELYSSEGCASCPPAEKWLAQLTNNPKLFKEFVPMEFHVDYWNRLGWVDPLSNKSFTNRQHRYAFYWGAKTAHTPQFVFNGTPSTFKETRKQNWAGAKNAGLLKLSRKSQNLFELSYAHSIPCQDLVVETALLQDGLTNVVLAGANKGMKLKHNFVVLETFEVLVKTDNKLCTSGISFETLVKDVKGKKLSIAVWLRKKTELTVLQAAGARL